MCRDATWQNPKLRKCVDLRALMDSWWNWNNRMVARLNLWTSTFKVMDFFNETRKVSKLENKICHDLNPRRSMDGSMRPNDPCRLREKITNSASCAGTKPRGTVNQNCRIWTCDQWLPHFLGISDGEIPVMVRRHFSSDSRANWFASLNARNEHVFGITGTDYKWATCPRTNRTLWRNPSFGGARAYK